MKVDFQKVYKVPGAPTPPEQHMSSSFVSSSSISVTNSEEISAICEDFLELSISEEKSEKMVKIVVKSFSEDALRKLFDDLSKKEYWDEECPLCSMPRLLHK